MDDYKIIKLEPYAKENLALGNMKVEAFEQKSKPEKIAFMLELNENVRYRNSADEMINIYKGDYLAIDEDGSVKNSPREINEMFLRKRQMSTEEIFTKLQERLKMKLTAQELILKNKFIYKTELDNNKIRLGTEFLKEKNIDFTTFNNGNKSILIYDAKDKSEAEKIKKDIERTITSSFLLELKEKLNNIDKMTKAELEDFKKEIESLSDTQIAKDSGITLEVSKDIGNAIDEQLKEIDNKEMGKSIETSMEKIDEIRSETERSFMDNVNLAIDDLEEDDRYEERSLF